jgi:LCP family protein required for cell wall assembly
MEPSYYQPQPAGINTTSPPALARRRSFRNRLLAVTAGLVLLAALGLYALVMAAQPKGEISGRTNVMIYGLTADGQRTDTMLLASYYWKEKKLVLLNIPRDLYASYGGHDTKIVSLYAIAKAERPADLGYPAQYVDDFISREYGITVDYSIVANMNAFKEIVDAVGGVTIDVSRPFTDYLYPTDDYSGYIQPAPHFNAGTQTMNGTRALIYARSRHADGPEGTDFARSKRQEVIIQALLNKLRQQGALTDVTKANSYLQIVRKNLSTSLGLGDIAKALQVASQLDFSKDIVMANWSNGIGFLCDSTDGHGSYVLRYGVPGDCTASAGTSDNSPYRLQAVQYVKNLLNAATSKS